MGARRPAGRPTATSRRRRRGRASAAARTSSRGAATSPSAARPGPGRGRRRATRPSSQPTSAREARQRPMDPATTSHRRHGRTNGPRGRGLDAEGRRAPRRGGARDARSAVRMAAVRPTAADRAPCPPPAVAPRPRCVDIFEDLDVEFPQVALQHRRRSSPSAVGALIIGVSLILLFYGVNVLEAGKEVLTGLYPPIAVTTQGAEIRNLYTVDLPHRRRRSSSSSRG